MTGCTTQSKYFNPSKKVGCDAEMLDNAAKSTLTRENFLIRLISLSSLLLQLENGPSASRHIRNVGLRLSEWINTMYLKELHSDRLTPEQYGYVIVDLKKRIDGDFYLIESREDRVIVGNHRCPFGAHVASSPNLCNITSSVFGGIAAENFGYGKVVLSQRIAIGDPECAVAVYLKPSPEADAEAGIVYTAQDLPHDYVDATFGLRWVPNRAWDDNDKLPAFIFDLPVIREDLLNAVGVGLAVVDANGHLVMLNAVAERWLARSQSLADEVQALARGARQQGLAQSSTEVQVASDGQHAWYELQTFVPAHLPGLDSLIILIRDRTTERMLQEEAIRAERLKAVGELAASAAHDLRNPLAAVYSLLELSALQPDLFPTVAGTMMDEVNRAARIINDYLDIAREPQLVLAPCSVREFVTELQEHVIPRCDAVGVSLQVHEADGEVLVDRNRLMDAVLNVVSNALEAMPGGGSLHIVAEVRARDVALHIADTGIGIPAESRERVWELFFTTKAKGTGVGLYACRRTIEQMNGHIQYSSTPNEGTTFTIVVPRARGDLDGTNSRDR